MYKILMIISEEFEIFYYYKIKSKPSFLFLFLFIYIKIKNKKFKRTRLHPPPHCSNGMCMSDGVGKAL